MATKLLGVEEEGKGGGRGGKTRINGTVQGNVKMNVQTLKPTLVSAIHFFPVLLLSTREACLQRKHGFQTTAKVKKKVWTLSKQCS